MNTELEFLMDMDEEQRRQFLRDTHIEEEEIYLRTLMERMKYDDAYINSLTRDAKQGYDDYTEFGRVEYLEYAEQQLKLAQLLKEDKCTIGDIREQRERIQWLRTQHKMNRPS